MWPRPATTPTRSSRTSGWRRTEGAEAGAMRTYLAKRLLLIVPTLLGVASLVFLIMRVIPGDVALLILGGDSAQIDRAQLAAMHRRLGLDQPLLVQFGTWLWGVLHFRSEE